MAAPTKAQLERELLEQDLRLRRAEAEKAEYEAASARRQDISNEAAEGQHRIYHFIGQVNDKSVFDCVQKLGLWARRSPGQAITLVLNSPGGGVHAGLALYDFILELRAKGHHVTTVARGYAASMGGVLLQAGDVRVVGPNAYVMIHEVSSGSIGKVSDQEEDLEFTKRLQDRLAEILAERSTLSKQQIKRKWLRKDWWLDATESVSYGFADRIG